MALESFTKINTRYHLFVTHYKGGENEKKKNSSPYKLLLSDGRMEWVYRFVHDCFYFDNINDIKRGM